MATIAVHPTRDGMSDLNWRFGLAEPGFRKCGLSQHDALPPSELKEIVCVCGGALSNVEILQ